MLNSYQSTTTDEESQLEAPQRSQTSRTVIALIVCVAFALGVATHSLVSLNSNTQQQLMTPSGTHTSPSFVHDLASAMRDIASLPMPEPTRVHLEHDIVKAFKDLPRVTQRQIESVNLPSINHHSFPGLKF